MASSSWDNTIKIWDLGRHEIHTTIETGFKLYGCRMDPVARYVLAYGGNRFGAIDYASSLIGLWDPISGVELAELDGHEEPVLSCDLASDGGFIVSASADMTLRIWR